MSASSHFRLASLAASFLVFSWALVAHAQTVTTVYSDAFLGSQINADFWISAGSATVNQSQLNVSGYGNYGTNGVASKDAYSRVNADLILDTDLAVSNCGATGTTAVMGYGDADPFASGSGDYIAAIASGTLVLRTYQNGSLQQQVSTGYVCTSNAPFHIKLVALQAGGAKLFLNGSTTPAAATANGTFVAKPIFLQAYQPGAMASFSNFFFSYLPDASASTVSGGAGSTGASSGGVIVTGSGASGSGGIVSGSPATSGSGIVAGGSATPGSGIVAGGSATAGSAATPQSALSGGTAPTTGEPLTAGGGIVADPTGGLQVLGGGTVSAGTAAPATTAQTTQNGIVPCDGTSVKCTFTSLLTLAQNIVTFLIGISATIATVMIAYAGYLYLTSAGNSGQAEKATKIFTNVVLGFIIVLAAYLIVHTLLSALVSTTP